MSLVAEKIYKGDVGVGIELETTADLTSATVFWILVQKPDLATTHWDCSGAVSGSTTVPTILRYVTKAGDLDQVGVYAVCAYVEFGATEKHTGEPCRFTIYELFEPSG